MCTLSTITLDVLKQIIFTYKIAIIIIIIKSYQCYGKSGMGKGKGEKEKVEKLGVWDNEIMIMNKKAYKLSQ